MKSAPPSRILPPVRVEMDSKSNSASTYAFHGQAEHERVATADKSARFSASTFVGRDLNAREYGGSPKPSETKVFTGPRILWGFNKGTTLVEVLTATAILALVIVGIMGIFTVSVQTSKKINYEYGATNLAKNRIERLKTVAFALLADAAENNIRINENGDADSNGLYLRTTTVTANYGGDAHLSSVQVQVYYEYGGVKNQVPATMTYLFTDVQ